MVCLTVYLLFTNCDLIMINLTDEPLSSVHAHFDHTEGLLSAAILTHVDHYYIEPSHRHFSPSHSFHMISYRGSDIKYNLTGWAILLLHVHVVTDCDALHFVLPLRFCVRFLGCNMRINVTKNGQQVQKTFTLSLCVTTLNLSNMQCCQFI